MESRTFQDDNIIRRMRFAYKVTHTHTHTHTEYVILIALSRQQRLRERASLLRYIYIACLAHSVLFCRKYINIIPHSQLRYDWRLVRRGVETIVGVIKKI
jgi:hypothetical protein